MRIILVPVFVIFIIQERYLSALLVFTAAGLTDALDGALARILKAQTKLGAYLDPIADKLLLVTSFVSLSVFGIIPAWLTVIVISRDMIILLGLMILTLLAVPYEISPAIVSKLTTVLQVGTIFLVLLYKAMALKCDETWLLGFFWATAVFTIVSGLVYIFRGIGFLNRANPQKE